MSPFARWLGAGAAAVAVGVASVLVVAPSPAGAVGGEPTGSGGAGVSELVPLVVELAAGAGTADLTRELAGTGATVTGDLGGFASVSVPRDEIDAVAAAPSTAGVGEDELLRPALDTSRARVGAATAAAAGYEGAGRAVAVLDTGVDAAHPFFGGRVSAQACYSKGANPADAAGDCPNGATTQTGAGAGAPCAYEPVACAHGTHVAGIAAGSGVDFSGVASRASVVAVQVHSNISGGPQAYASDLAAGMQWVATNASRYQIAAANLSVASASVYAGTCDAVLSPSQQALKAAIDQARAAGVVVVAAAGNNGSSTALSFPGCLSNVVSVGIVDDADAPWYSGNASSQLSLWAPGVAIVSAVPGGGYEEKTGTSMAAPHAAGAVALLRQRFPNDTVEQLVARLTTSTVPVTDPRSGLTKPRLDVVAALGLTPPGPPAGVVAWAGNQQAVVGFSAPAANGGAPVTGYEVTASPGGQTAIGALSPITVTGLTNGTAYRFTVRATNAVGTGPPSSPSPPVTPASVPGAPTAVSAAPAAGQALVSFLPPADDGGNPITAYTVVAAPGGAQVTGPTSPLLVTGLDPATSYTFTVFARNDVGPGPPSVPSAPIVPSPPPGVPGPPTNPRAVGGDARAVVTFGAPASSGGSPVTGYTVTAQPGGVQASGAGSPIVVTGLEPATAYRFTVAATNAAGTGAQSPPTNGVTTRGSPAVATRVPGWVFETLDGEGGGGGRVPSDLAPAAAALTVGGVPHVWYRDGETKSLRHAWWWGAGWAFETLDRVGATGADVTATSWNGRPHVFYRRTDTGDLRHAWWDGRAWSFQTLDAAGDTGLQPTALEFNGGLHVWYRTAGGGLRHAWWWGFGWAFETLDAVGDTGVDATAVLYGGLPHVFYRRADTGDLRHAWWWGFGWAFETLDSSGDAGYAPAAVVFGGEVHVWHRTAGVGLRHVWWTGRAWRSETLDARGDTGFDAAAALVGGTPHVWYRRADTGDLSHAWWWGFGWAFETLDGAGGANRRVDSDLGASPSVAFFGGAPHVWYLDERSGDLRHGWYVG